MTTFLLVRHGETDAIGRFLAGSKPGCHLNRNGEEQARSLARRLSPFSIRAIYTSPLERCIETANALAEPQRLVPGVREDLREFAFGAWEGRSFGQLATDPEWLRFNTQRALVRAPGGELMIEVQTRMVKTIEALRPIHDGEIVAIVGHGDPLRSVIAHYLGLPLDLLLRFEISPASVSVIQIHETGPHILCINQMEHIPL
jgi:broad specificity phosphatase PhoE